MSGGAWFVVNQMRKAGKEREERRVNHLRHVNGLRTAWVGKLVYCRTDQGAVPGSVVEIRDDGLVYVLWTYEVTGQSGYLMFDQCRIDELLTLRG